MQNSFFFLFLRAFKRYPYICKSMKNFLKKMLGHVLIARATKIASLILKKYQKSQVVKILFLSYSKRFAVFFPNNIS